MQPSFGYNLLKTKLNYFILYWTAVRSVPALYTLYLISNNFHYRSSFLSYVYRYLLSSNFALILSLI